MSQSCFDLERSFCWRVASFDCVQSKRVVVTFSYEVWPVHCSRNLNNVCKRYSCSDTFIADCIWSLDLADHRPNFVFEECINNKLDEVASVRQQVCTEKLEMAAACLNFVSFAVMLEFEVICCCNLEQICWCVCIASKQIDILWWHIKLMRVMHPVRIFGVAIDHH